MRRFAVALVVGALVTAVVPASAQAPRALVVQAATEPPGLDLTATPASATAGVVLYNVQECLVKVDAHGKIVPWLAERWHTADNRNYTFFLKKGVRFHNGRELKAADVKFVIERAMNPETKHPYPQYYAAISDIVVKDDYTITFALKAPTANFLLNLARQGSVIYPREAVDTLKSAPVGTGPFTLADWVRGDKIVLKRNPEYHVKGLPKLEQVTFRFIADPNAALAALKAGDVDASLFGLGPEHVADLRKDARFEVIVGETTNDVIMAMNNTRKPFTDVRVRRAVTHGINRPEVVKLAMFGLGRVIGSNVDPLNPYFVDLANAMPYDPAKAKKLLAEAGYPNGFDAVLKVAPQYYYTVRSGEVITDHLKKIGVNVKIEQIEWGQWLARVWKEADYDLTIIGHAEAWDIANYANPKYYFRYDSAKFQDLYARSETTVEDKPRRDLYAQMQRMLVDDAPVVFLFIHPRLVVAKKGVTGIWKDLPIPSADLSEVGWAAK
ncbi:MAG TPA: ABC transporter substrate-binding protein [Methylomirabilota bacterium]|jgi:peptide/nickel transport system substrate-binding protein|nr:ABC transporter substrate-binding protein [Methylomirabilota bacterium]